MKTKETKEKKKISILLLIFRIFSILIILACLYEIYLWYQENKENASLTSEITSDYVDGTEAITLTLNDNQQTSESNEQTYEFPNVNFEELESSNKNTTAWIKVNNTNIDFPIVQYTDNSYYLTHNFKGNYNKAGWIFADYRNNLTTLDKNTIIYGHNRRNGTMFGKLLNLLDESWFDNSENTYFYFETKDKKYIAEIFSVYKANSSTLELNNTFETDEAYLEYINEIKNLSIHNFNLDITTNDNIITLCTCDNNTKYRVLVHAKLVEAK